MSEALRFSAVLILAIVIASFPFWYPELSETGRLRGKGETATVRGLKEVGSHYVVVTTAQGDIAVNVRGWYGRGMVKWSEVLKDLRAYIGREVIIEAEDEGGLVARGIEVLGEGVRY